MRLLTTTPTLLIRSVASCTFSLVSTLAACGPIGDVNGNDDVDAGVDGGDGLPAASDFSCADDRDGSDDACVDFNSGAADAFSVEAGAWEVVGGRYVGHGPDVFPGCGDSLLSASMLSSVTAQDVRVSLRLASVERVDKVLVLRSVDEGDRLELNFRALYDGDYGDLVVQELRGCVGTALVTEGEVAVPHDVGAWVEAVVELRGQHLAVDVGGARVLDRDLDILAQPGAVGVAVIERGTSVFDDVVVDVLDN